MNAPAVEHDQEGLKVEEIFALVKTLNPQQRLALAFTLLNAARLEEFARCIQSTFPDVDPAAILDIVRVTVRSSIPPR